jgi:hypothetical protein
LAHGNAVLEQLKMSRFNVSTALLETMGKCSHARGVTRSAAVGAIDVLLMLVSHVSVGGNFKRNFEVKKKKSNNHQVATSTH